MPETRCILRLFGAKPAELAEAVRRFSPQWQADAQWQCRGGEILLALRAKSPSCLRRAAQSLRTALPAALYGAGATTLSAATVEALEHHDRLLVCGDAAAGALLETRLEPVPGAERVFDFGALSYAEPKAEARIVRRAAAKLHTSDAQTENPIRVALARAQAARRVVGAELAVGCAEQGSDRVLVLNSKKGSWLRTVSLQDNPGLWLLDMVRRAASGLPQAAGTGFLPASRRLAADPTAAALPAAPKRRGRFFARTAAVMAVLCAAAFSAAWYFTGGHLDTLPELLESLDPASLPHPGAKLV